MSGGAWLGTIAIGLALLVGMIVVGFVMQKHGEEKYGYSMFSIPSLGLMIISIILTSAGVLILASQQNLVLGIVLSVFALVSIVGLFIYNASNTSILFAIGAMFFQFVGSILIIYVVWKAIMNKD